MPAFSRNLNKFAKLININVIYASFSLEEISIALVPSRKKIIKIHIRLLIYLSGGRVSF